MVNFNKRRAVKEINQELVSAGFSAIGTVGNYRRLAMILGKLGYRPVAESWNYIPFFRRENKHSETTDFLSVNRIRGTILSGQDRGYWGQGTHFVRVRSQNGGEIEHLFKLGVKLEDSIGQFIPVLPSARRTREEMDFIKSRINDYFGLRSERYDLNSFCYNVAIKEDAGR